MPLGIIIESIFALEIIVVVVEILRRGAQTVDGVSIAYFLDRGARSARVGPAVSNLKPSAFFTGAESALLQ
jgi:hypothetical protein